MNLLHVLAWLFIGSLVVAKEFDSMSQRKIVIVGAGIAGTGLADELAMRKAGEITVIDQGPLFKTGGATSHAPGLMTRTSPSEMMFCLANYTIEKLLSLDHDGEPCFHNVGAIEIATTSQRWSYLQRRREFALSWGFDGRIIDASEAASLNPLLDPHSILGGYHTTGEGIGKALRGATVQGLRAQSNGVTFIGDTRVLNVITDNERATGVKTALGVIPADIVILAAGSWGKGLAASAGVTLPMVAMEHQYAITDDIDMIAEHSQFDASLPFIRHFDGGVYMRNEGAGVGIGSFNHKALPLSDDEMVNGNERRHDPSMFDWTPEDWTEAWDETVAVMPALRDAKLVTTYNGVFPYTPDGYPLIGPAPRVDGLWVLECVWATHAIGAARSLAEMIVGEEPTVDITPADIARFDGPELSRLDFEERCDHSYVDTYAIHHPAEPSVSPRGVRLSPFYADQEKRGAEFFDTSAWERPRWYASNSNRLDGLTIPKRDEWSSRHWSAICGAEHLATRESVGVFDMTSLRRILVTGPDAARLLNTLASRNVDRSVGSATYAIFLNSGGRIVSDVTISRLAEDRFLVGGNSARDELWIKSHSAGMNVHVEDVTAGTACIAVWGPASRDAMAKIADTDLSNQEFPYFTARDIEVAGVKATAVRVSYVGELGWEFSCDADVAPRLWNAIVREVQSVGGVVAGRGALTSLRIEKGYRAWGTDMSRRDTPAEAGLEFAIRSGEDHLGVKAAERAGLRRRLRTLHISDPSLVPTIGQPVLHEGRAIGNVTSSEYGWSVGKSLAYVWLPTNCDIGSEVFVSCGGLQVPAHVVADVQFDPDGMRVRS